MKFWHKQNSFTRITNQKKSVSELKKLSFRNKISEKKSSHWQYHCDEISAFKIYVFDLELEIKKFTNPNSSYQLCRYYNYDCVELKHVEYMLLTH